MTRVATDQLATNRPAISYEPRGAAVEAWKCKLSEVLLSGPAGTGKSRMWLERLNVIALKYPMSRHLIVRKTKASLAESTLVTWEQHVRPWCGSSETDRVERTHRHSYKFPNGAEVVIGGMDKATKILSTEYDTIYVPEAVELSVTDWETLTTRLRNNQMPYQQIVADTNPDRPSHWIYQRCQRGTTQIIHANHHDNPLIWDAARAELTEYGVNYMSKLDSLTGVRKHRLRDGLWVAAEGMVFDEYDPAHHLGTLEEIGSRIGYDLSTGIPASWRRFISIDFGFTNPFVAQWWALSPDDVLILYREIYKTHSLVEDLAPWIKRESQGERISATIADHDAEDRATLARKGISTIPAKKAVSSGIQAMSARFKINPLTGKARIYFVRGARCHAPDEMLVEQVKPTCTAEELEGYIWEDAAKKDAPVKRDDHGLDPARYLCLELEPRKPTRNPQTHNHSSATNWNT